MEEDKGKRREGRIKHKSRPYYCADGIVWYLRTWPGSASCCFSHRRPQEEAGVCKYGKTKQQDPPPTSPIWCSFLPPFPTIPFFQNTCFEGSDCSPREEMWSVNFRPQVGTKKAAVWAGGGGPPSAFPKPRNGRQTSGASGESHDHCTWDACP